MKKSELRKLIKQTIKETGLPLNEQVGQFFEKLLSNFTPVDGSYANERYMKQGEGIRLWCIDDSRGPSAFQQGDMSLTRGEFDVVTVVGNVSGNNPEYGDPFDMSLDFRDPGTQRSRILVKCKGTQKAKDFATIPQNDDTADLVRHRCGVNGICQPDENGPFISLQQCQQSGCGPDSERDPKLEPVTPYVGNTGRPSPGGPLEEIVEKISKKLGKMKKS